MGLLISICEQCDECIRPKFEDIEDDEVPVRKCLPGGKSFLIRRKTSRLGNKVEIPYELFDKNNESFDKNKKSVEKRRPSYLH